MAKKKKKAGDINSSSMADIAFLLLIFFLVTTTMDVDTGMKRSLPPWVNPEEQKNDVEENKRNVLQIRVSRSGNIMVGSTEYTAADLRRNKMVEADLHSRLSEEVLYFLKNDDRSDKIDVVVNGVDCKVSKGVVSLQADDETKYAIYLQVQDELTHAFNVYRNKIAMQTFNKEYKTLVDEQQKEIRKVVPMRISEAEPNDQTKK